MAGCVGPWDTHDSCARGRAVSTPKGNREPSRSSPCGIGPPCRQASRQPGWDAGYCGSRDGVHGIVGGSREQDTKYFRSGNRNAGVETGCPVLWNRDRCSVLEEQRLGCRDRDRGRGVVRACPEEGAPRGTGASSIESGLGVGAQTPLCCLL